MELKEVEEKRSRVGQFIPRVMSEIKKSVVGQEYMVERLLVGLLANGHVLLEGVPGLAKTTTVKALAEAIAIHFGRITFTPDLLPSDLIGTQIYSPRDGTFSTRKGPVFTQILLADEINRAPSKVQSALLECMQERQVTIGDESYRLAAPFLVLATQNPLEQEGTYPLPEAQVDRFLLKLKIDYPKKSEERQIVDLLAGKPPAITPVASVAEILEAIDLVNHVHIQDKLKDYIVDLVFCSRDPVAYGLKNLMDKIEWGASPRASISLARSAKAYAFLKGRAYVTPQDIKSIAPDVFRHRILLSYEAEAEEMSSDDVIQMILDKIEVP